MSEFEKKLVEDLDKLGKDFVSDLKKDQIKSRLFSRLGIDDSLIKDVQKVGDNIELSPNSKARIKESVFARIENLSPALLSNFFTKYSPMFSMAFVFAIVVLGGVILLDSDGNDVKQVSFIPEANQTSLGLESAEVDDLNVIVPELSEEILEEEPTFEPEIVEVQQDEVAFENSESVSASNESTFEEDVESNSFVKTEDPKPVEEIEEEPTFVAVTDADAIEQESEATNSNTDSNALVMIAEFEVEDDFFENVDSEHRKEPVLEDDSYLKMTTSSSLMIQTEEAAEIKPQLDYSLLEMQSSAVQKCVVLKQRSDKVSSVETLINVCKKELINDSTQINFDDVKIEFVEFQPVLNLELNNIK